MRTFPAPTTSSLLGPNILLSTLFSKTLNLRFSISVKGHVLQPYKTTGKMLCAIRNKLVFTVKSCYTVL